MPRLYVIDTDVMNAYASGIDNKSYAITVTRGLLDSLSPQELEAVLAHELTHIIDRDTRLLIVTVVFVGMISFFAQLLWRGLRVVSFGRGGRSSKGGGAVVILVLIAAVVMLVGYLLALVLRFALSRRRELLADAGSVELTKNPDALISALLKISKNAEVPHVPSEVRQMFIENPPSTFDLGGLFATHPPIASRIHVLEELGGQAPSGTA
jgi:heat shock protein HtpX